MTALKKLENIAFEAKRLKYKDQPHLIRKKYSDKTANELTKSIIAYIQLMGGQAERISTTGRVIDNRKNIGTTKWIPGTTTKGSADISATIQGRSVKIEVKIGKDKQSDAQLKYQAEIEKSGGIYYVARNFEDFFKWYNETF